MAEPNAGNANGLLNANNNADDGEHAHHPAPPHHFNLPEAIKLVRRYNGRTDVNQWILKFENDLLAFGISYTFAIFSLERFFVDDALNWWSSVSHRFQALDVLERDEGDYRQMWREIAQEMQTFFDHSALQAQNRKRNKQLLFKLGEDPQTYVTKKLALLTEIDREMREESRVKNLIRGLPVELQFQFSSQDITTVGQFLNRLRRYSEIAEENKKKTPSSLNTEASVRDPNSSSAPQSMQALNNRASETPRPNANFNCYACNEPGHIARNCPHASSQHVNNNASAFTNRQRQNNAPLFPRGNFYANRNPFNLGRGYFPMNPYFPFFQPPYFTNRNYRGNAPRNFRSQVPQRQDRNMFQLQDSQGQPPRSQEQGNE